MSEHSESPDFSEQMEEELWRFLYFHWAGHIIVFGVTFLGAYLTHNHLITAGAILIFIAHLLIMAPIDIIHVCRHYREERRFIPLYVAQYSLYLFFSGVLIVGWLVSYTTGRHLYTAMGMFFYAVSPLFFRMYDLAKKKGRK